MRERKESAQRDKPLDWFRVRSPWCLLIPHTADVPVYVVQHHGLQ